MFTVSPEDERRGRAQHFVARHRVVDHAGVVANVGALHLRHVQVPRFLGDEATAVLLDEIRVLVEDPGVGQLWGTEVKRSPTLSLQDDPVTLPQLLVSAAAISVFLGGTPTAHARTIRAEGAKGAKPNGLQRVSGPPPAHGLLSEGPELGFMGGWMDAWKQGRVLMPPHERVSRRDLPP